MHPTCFMHMRHASHLITPQSHTPLGPELPHEIMYEMYESLQLFLPPCSHMGTPQSHMPLPKSFWTRSNSFPVIPSPHEVIYAHVPPSAPAHRGSGHLPSGSVPPPLLPARVWQPAPDLLIEYPDVSRQDAFLRIGRLLEGEETIGSCCRLSGGIILSARHCISDPGTVSQAVGGD